LVDDVRAAALPPRFELAHDLRRRRAAGIDHIQKQAALATIALNAGRTLAEYASVAIGHAELDVIRCAALGDQAMPKEQIGLVRAGTVDRERLRLLPNVECLVG